jgi:Tfp pilus assembly protein PilZ/lambda repressor-like predicted transcriptional regulator
MVPPKIISRVQAVMTEKGLTVRDLNVKTGLPHATIRNACSEKIIYCGLNILNLLASAMGVSVKDLFAEVDLSPNKPALPKIKTSGTNISVVTNRLIRLVMQMSHADKDKLLEKFNELKKGGERRSNTANVTTDLIELVMKMSLEDRCQLLSDLMSYTGMTKRKYGRSKYIKPVHFSVKGVLYQGNTKNISRGGVFIEAKGQSQHFSVGDSITINLEHPQTRKYVKITGSIVWIAENGFGVRFDETL